MSGSKRGIGFEWLLIAVVLIGATLGSTAMLVFKTEPPKQESKAVGPLVEVQTVRLKDVPVRVTGHGQVQAKVRAKVVPQVGGRVVKLHEQMVAGGLIPAGESLIEIDADDYRLAADAAEADLQRARASKQSAEAMISEAQTRLDDAREDYQRMQALKSRDVATQRELDKAKVDLDVAEAALRSARSQHATAEAQIAAAQVALDRAQLDLKRTKLTMPFDAVVAEETIDEGQYVTPGQSVGEVYGTRMIEIPVPLIDEELRWLPHIPVAGESRSNPNSAQRPAAQVTATLLGKRCQWTGKVARAEGQLDPRTRMIHLVVQVENPFDSGSPPLIPGAFVDVSIQGRSLDRVAALPRHALHENGASVWVVRDGRLRIQPVRVARAEGDMVYIDQGLDDGAQVIVSALDVATDGMKVRTPQQTVAESEPDPETEP